MTWACLAPTASVAPSDECTRQTLHLPYGLWYNESEAMGDTMKARNAHG